MWHLCAIIFTLIFIFLVIDYLKNRSFYKKASYINGPTALPILGNILCFFSVKNIMNFKPAIVHEMVMKYCDVFPSPFRLWIGGALFIPVYDPEDVKAVFMSPKTLSKSEFYKYAVPLLGKGLIVAPVDVWKRNRKLIQPTFNTKILQSFLEVFNKHSKLFVEHLISECRGIEVNIFEAMSACNMNIICETVMGISMTWSDEQHLRFVKATKRAMEVMATRHFYPWLHLDFIFKLSQMSRDYDKCIEYMNKVTSEVIQKKKRELENGENQNKLESSVNQRKAFLDLLLEMDEKLSDEQIRDEVTVMIIGGTDTTASTLSFCSVLLASHPEIQEKVYQELWEIYGDDNNASVTNEDLTKMVYMEMVIKESLRLFPVAPLFMRQVTEDLETKNCILPKGASIVLALSKLHRDEKIWPDPLKFNPDRFLPEEVAKRHPFSFVPFAAGPRNCIGLKYAMMAMKVLLATILRKCVIKNDNILPVKDIKVSLDIMLKPDESTVLRFEERVKNFLNIK